MESRPDLSYDLPRFAIAYLTDDGWKTSLWKMTIPYAKVQFAGQTWWPIFPSCEYYDGDTMPIINGSSMSRFLR